MIILTKNPANLTGFLDTKHITRLHGIEVLAF